MTAARSDDDSRRLRHDAAEEVRVALTRRRMSGAELARRMGRSQTFIAKRLDGRQAFDLDDLETIGAILGVSPASFLPAPAPAQVTAAGLGFQSGGLPVFHSGFTGPHFQNGAENAATYHGSSARYPHGNVVDLAQRRHASGPIDQVEAA